MNNAIKVGMAFAGAAAIAVGGTAFTATNDMTSNPVMGYGTQTVTGVVASNTAYSYSEAGAALELDRVVYTVAAMPDHTNVTADLTVDGVGALGAPVTTACVVTNNTTITCDDETAALGYLVEDVTAISLAVKQSGTTQPA